MPRWVPPLLLSVCALAACESDRTHFDKVYDPCSPLVLVPEDASADERGAVADAIALWSEVANVGLTLDEPEGIEGVRRLPIRFDRSELYMGWFDDIEGVIWLSRRVPERDMRAVVIAHELGHAFNLYHLPEGDESSVMAKGNYRIGPTLDDAAQLVYKWGECARR